MPERDSAESGVVVAKRLSLRGVTCPINFVRTKLALEQVAIGECVEVTVDGGQPAANVPRSAKLEGQEVVSDCANKDGSHTLIIKRLR